MTNENIGKTFEREYEILDISPFLSEIEFLMKASKLGATGIRGSGPHRVALKPIADDGKLSNQQSKIK